MDPREAKFIVYRDILHRHYEAIVAGQPTVEAIGALDMMGRLYPGIRREYEAWLKSDASRELTDAPE